MNILGQDFDSWVTKQVDFRQESLSRGSGENFYYINNQKHHGLD